MPPTAPPETGVESTAQEVDKVLDRIERSVKKVDAAQSSIVRLRKAEIDLLGQLEVIRDLVEKLLKGGDRELLSGVFADCGRVARLRACLESVSLSEMNARDQRFPTCSRACSALEEVLRKELNVADMLEEVTRRKSDDLLEARVSVLLDPEKVDELKAQLADGEEGDAKVASDDDDDAGDEDEDEDGDDDEDEEEESGDDEGKEGERIQPSCAGDEPGEDDFVAHARQMFDELDKNRDGQVSKLDLRQAARSSKDLLKRLKLRSGKQFALFFKQADAGQSGTVDFEAFLAYLESLQTRRTTMKQKRGMQVDDATLQIVFNTFDSDSDGHLSLQELKMAYAGVRLKAGRRVDARRVAAWCKTNLKKYDEDGSKTLCLSEFRRLLENSGALLPLMRQAASVADAA